MSVDAKAKIVASVYGDGFEIQANRAGLRQLAQICLDLAELPEDEQQARQLGNHYHFEAEMFSAEPGSVPILVTYKPEL